MVNVRPSHLIAIALSLLLTAAIFLLNPATYLREHLGEWGYLGIFVIMLLNNATIILPAPGQLAVLAAGSTYNFALVGLVGGLGAAFGELTGYLFGYGGKGMLGKKQHPLSKKVNGWMGKNGFVTLAFLAAIPNPLFDVAGMAAGALGYSWWKFLIACAIGAIIKSTIFAYLGHLLL